MSQGPAAAVVRNGVRHPSGILLVVQLLGVLLYPYMQQSMIGRVTFEAFGVLVLTLAIWSLRDSAGRTSIAISLGILGSALSITDTVHHSPAVALAGWW